MELTEVKVEDIDVDEVEEDSCQPLALVTPNNRKHFPSTSPNQTTKLKDVLQTANTSSPGDEATVSTTTPTEADRGRAGAATPPDSTHHVVSSSQAVGKDKGRLFSNENFCNCPPLS